MSIKKKILYLTFRPPFPAVSGEKIRSFHTLQYLIKNNEVTLVSFYKNKVEKENLKEYGKSLTDVIPVRYWKFISLTSSFLGLFSKKPLQVSFFFAPNMKQRVRRLLKHDFDVVICHLIRMAHYVPKGTHIRKIIDLTDAISLNYLRSLQHRTGLWKLIYKLEIKRIYNYEQKCIREFDKSILVSDIDADFVRNESNMDKIHVIGNGVDILGSEFQSEYDNNTISFLGCMRTFPNRDAVLFFVNQILPLLMDKNPNIKFYIVGGEPAREIRDLHNGSNIIVTGHVDSVIVYIKNSVTLVAPMRVGAGVQNKILEAMSIGTPVVTSSIGAEGLNHDSLIVEDDISQFAEKVYELMVNKKLRNDYSNRGKEYIKQNHNWDETLKGMDTLL